MRLHRVAAVAAFTLATTGVLRPLLHLSEPATLAADAQLSGDLAKAIRAGDLDAVKEAVEKGADINALDERKMPPIGAAALLGKVDIVNYLAEKGADLNKNDGYGFTPLMCAAQRGQAGAVRALIKHGADPAAKGGNGSDALYYAQPKGPADPIYDQKQAVIKILKEAIAKKGGDATPATPATPQAPAQPQPQPQPQPPAAPQVPAANVTVINGPAIVIPPEQSAIVNKNADGTLGVAEKDGKPIDGVKLSTHDRDEGSPCLAVAPDGSIHAVFNEKHGPPYMPAVYHRMSTDGGKTWSEAKNLSEEQVDVQAGYCRVIADPQNRVYVIWRSGLGQNFQASLDPYGGSHANLVYRVLQNGKWSKVIPVHPPGSAKDQNDGSIDWYAALDPAGRVNVVWNTTPNKWHDELVDIKVNPGVTYRFQYNGVGNGLVFQATLDGAAATPPKEAMLTPVTGSKAAGYAHQPACNGLQTLNGFIDPSGQPLFIARVTSTTDETLRNKYRYQLFEHGTPGAFIDLPDLSFHAWRDIPTLLVDAQGKRHAVVLYPAGEHPSVRDYVIGGDEEPTIVKQAANNPKASIIGMQAYQGPGGRMIACMEFNDTGETGEGDLFVSTSTGGGQWSPPVNVTNNAARRSWAARQTGIVSNVAISKTFNAGPAAAAIDREGHLCLLMIQNERGIFGSQVGVGYIGGSSTTPTMYFLRF